MTIVQHDMYDNERDGGLRLHVCLRRARNGTGKHASVIQLYFHSAPLFEYSAMQFVKVFYRAFSRAVNELTYANQLEQDMFRG